MGMIQRGSRLGLAHKTLQILLVIFVMCRQRLNGNLPVYTVYLTIISIIIVNDNKTNTSQSKTYSTDDIIIQLLV
jgi:hypothetical protein